MNSTGNTIGEIVALDYRTAAVFKNYGIDFCCNGKRTIGAACETGKINEAKLMADLEQVVTVQTGNVNFNSWDLDLLADYVEKKHHRSIREKAPLIIQYLNKLCKVHGSNHSELFEITSLFKGSIEELTSHMNKEEQILFPAIRKVMNNQEGETAISIRAIIDRMMQDHDAEGERFRKIAELTGNYIAPADACNTYKVTFALLKEFEDDLHLHIHLENNILFPKAIAREKALQDVEEPVAY
jgi:regulator of cell morphogenesis and NO signaling